MDENAGDTSSDVLQVAAGVSVLALALSIVLAAGGGAFLDHSQMALVAFLPLTWAAIRPSWLSGTAATTVAFAPLTFSALGIAMIPVLALATLTLCWQRARRALTHGRD